MTTQEVLELDCRVEQSKITIQKVLRKIGPLSRFDMEEDVPIGALEKVMSIIEKKYSIYIACIAFDPISNVSRYIMRADIAEIRTAEHGPEIYPVTSVYGISMYEVKAKSVIAAYNVVKTKGKRRK